MPFLRVLVLWEMQLLINHYHICGCERLRQTDRQTCESIHTPAVFFVTQISSWGLVTSLRHAGRGPPDMATGKPRGRFPPPALNRFVGVKFIAWRLRRLFRGMPTEPEAFLEPPGVSGRQLCARTHLKNCLYHTQLVGRSYDKILRDRSTDKVKQADRRSFENMICKYLR